LHIFAKVLGLVLAAGTVSSAPAIAQDSRTVDEAPRFTWKRYPANPIFPVTAGTWREAQTANPDLLLLGDTCYM